MRVCGIEISAKEANICLLQLKNGMFLLPECRARKFAITNDERQEEMVHFQNTVKKLVEDYKVEAIVIRTRPQRGKFAGSAVGFKMEGILQASSAVPVHLLSAVDVKNRLKNATTFIDFRDTGLKKFQQVAFDTAFAYFFEPSKVADE